MACGISTIIIGVAQIFLLFFLNPGHPAKHLSKTQAELLPTVYTSTYLLITEYSKTGHSNRRPIIGFQYRLSLNAGQKYCKREHSAILSTFIKLPFAFKTFIWSIFEWPLKTGS